MCESCPIGKFGDAPGLSACAGVCTPAAGFGCALGATTAAGTACPAGRFNNGSFLTCGPCPWGSYGAVAGLTSAACTGTCPLPGGRLCWPGSTNSSGVPCPPGRYLSPGVVAQCSLCPAGRFGVSVGQTQCSPCPPGTYSTVRGSTDPACTPCPEGRYGSVYGEASPLCSGVCSTIVPPYTTPDPRFGCPAGNPSPSGLACPLGRYADSDGVPCIECPVGKYAMSSGTSRSNPCAGFCFQSGLDGTWCPPGAIDQPYATPCPPGRFKDWQRTGCEQCGRSACARSALRTT